MGKKNPQPGAGTVPIMLGGEQMELVPSLDACRQISHLAGNSLTAAVMRVCERLDFEFIVDVIALGLGATSPALKKEVAEKVYRDGVISLAADVGLYIRAVMNGGIKPEQDEYGLALDLLDRFSSSLPDGIDGAAQSVEQLRRALVDKMTEAEEEPADPLPETRSLSESSIDA